MVFNSIKTLGDIWR